MSEHLAAFLEEQQGLAAAAAGLYVPPGGAPPLVPVATAYTTAALRANEIGADAILKATKVDGIYDADPQKNPDAKKFEHITFSDALQRRLQVMDSTAFSLCLDNKMPIVVFNIADSGNIKRAVLGEPVGTLVTGG